MLNGHPAYPGGRRWRSRSYLIAVAACAAVLVGACTSPEAGDPTADVDPDDREAFAALAREGVAGRSRVSYRGEVEGDETREIEELIVAEDPPRRSVRYTLDGQRVFLLFEAEGDVVACATPGEPCVRLGGVPEGLAAGGALGPLFRWGPGGRRAWDPEELEAYAGQGRTEIAGRAGVCAQWQPAEQEDTTVQACLAEDSGVLLSASWVGPDGERGLVEATEVGEADREDFEPTGEVQDLPARGDD